MKNKTILLLSICPLLISACSGESKILDDIDLTYYVHHVNHNIFRYSNKAIVTLKNLGSNDYKTYTFTDLIWSEDYYWTSGCEEYEKYNEPIGCIFTENSIINDEIAAGFINDQYWNIISSIDYYGDNKNERQEESQFLGRIARLKGDTLTLINQWSVISFTDKTETSDGEGDEENTIVEYENPKGIICVSKAIYSGEKIDSFSIYLTNKLYMRDDDQNSIIEYHEEVFNQPIDYLEYKISFEV